MSETNEQPRSDLEASQLALRAEDEGASLPEAESELAPLPNAVPIEVEPEGEPADLTLSGEDVDDSLAFSLTSGVMGFERGTLLEAIEGEPVEDSISFRIVFAEDLSAAGAEDEGFEEEVAPLGWFFLHEEVRPLTVAARELHERWAKFNKKRKKGA